MQSPGPVQSTAQNVNPYNVAQSTAQAVADARKAADYMNATAPGSPAAQQATRAYMETQRLATMANATHDPNIARQAVQASQASVNHTNNVATGRSPNTYSPYNSNGNATSYFNSSYQSGKAPSPDAPRIEDVTGDSVYYCSIAKRVPNTNALGAGDYGSAALSQAWDSVVAWAKTDKGQKTLMTIASAAEIVGGGILLTTGVGGPAGTILLASGVSSLFGGYANELNGGTFFAGWAGGEVSGLLTGVGFASGGGAVSNIVKGIAVTGRDVLKSLGITVGSAFAGGSSGGFVGNLINQTLDGREINTQEAVSSGLASGIIAAIASPFGLTTYATAEASKGISALISAVNEGTFDLFTATLSNGG